MTCDGRLEEEPNDSASPNHLARLLFEAIPNGLIAWLRQAIWLGHLETAPPEEGSGSDQPMADPEPSSVLFLRLFGSLGNFVASLKAFGRSLGPQLSLRFGHSAESLARLSFGPRSGCRMKFGNGLGPFLLAQSGVSPIGLTPVPHLASGSLKAGLTIGLRPIVWLGQPFAEARFGNVSPVGLRRKPSLGGSHYVRPPSLGAQGEALGVSPEG